ncbi:unnamed protein product [Mytilus coruscus]|uniref:Uncharacterized protein n=1 Tax=Mytilus coruscus TaxID=42192 RepID=A0A6J8DQS5_MYTCO|nr:unnamed protein product [Mytilus coruscus]
MQHGLGCISFSPKDQGVCPRVVENKDHDSGVLTTWPSLSAHGALAVADTLPLPDGDIISKPHMHKRKSIGQDKDPYFHPKQDLTKNESTAHTVSSGLNDVKVKPSKYDDNTPCMDYSSHFEICVLVNMWSEHQKVNTLEERFAPSSQFELHRVQFKDRRQKASETLPELGQSVRRLSNLAYTTAPLELRETIAKEQFIDA